MLTEYSYDQIARFLTNDGWAFFYTDPQKFDVTSGDTLTVNITDLNEAGQLFARNAFALWTDVSGLNFGEVTFAAKIKFTHGSTDDEAFEDSVLNANGNIESALVTISANLLVEDWAKTAAGAVEIDQGTYSAVTFVHETGHALGLAHAGNYNGDAVFATDALYLNDSTQASIMSYFDPDQNPNITSSAFTAVTPMIADIIAIQNLYGTNVSTQSGDTVYGKNSSLGTAIDMLSDTENGAGIGFTVFDTGGTDTFDFSHSDLAQRIDVSSEGISGVLGEQGNLIIARGTVIENVVTGSGSDNITGNGSVNQISTGSGNDFILAGAGSDVIDGGADSDMASFSDAASAVRVNLVDGEALSGVDTNTLASIENITGSIYGDYIVGDENANRLRGLGNYDWFVGSAGNDSYDGGNGRDTISYVDASAGVSVDLGDSTNNAGLAAGDSYISIERITGSVHVDAFYGGAGENDFRGLGGYDVFYGSAGGRERYDGGNGSDTVTYVNSTSGVIASLMQGYGSGGDASLDLYTSIENLGGTSFGDTLTGTDERNNLRGLSGDDVLFGAGGIDRISGGRGNDVIDGGAGSDYILYDGNSNDFEITRDGSTRNAVVSWMGSGAGDGTDTLSNIEYLVFDDVTLDIWSL